MNRIDVSDKQDILACDRLSAIRDLQLTPTQKKRQDQQRHQVRQKIGILRLLMFQFVSFCASLKRQSKPQAKHQAGHETRKPWMPIVKGLPAQRFYDEEMFPWVSILKDNHKAIRSELKALLVDQGSMSPHRADIDEQEGWTAFDFIRGSKLIQAAVDRCPMTGKVFSQIPAVIYAGIAAVAPGRVINPHYGPSNGMIVCHFGIMNCAESYINVGGEIREYAEGGLMAFDDTYLHAAINAGEKTRYTLMFCTPHPQISQAESNIIISFSNLIMGPSESELYSSHH